MTTWLDVEVGEPSVDELPYGVFSTGGNRHLCVAIGSWVFDLHRAANVGLYLDAVRAEVLMGGSLNPLLELGPKEWAAVRLRTIELLSDEMHRAQVAPLLLDSASVQLHLPWQVADFVDFYSSRQHAENVGRLFRPDGEPLPPNWRHLPVGYHGRAGTVVVSGTDIHRPQGQRPVDGEPAFGPTRQLDFEIELGFVLGNPTTHGFAVSPADAGDHIFGAVVVNDWSARDIQSFEYQPLGPFLGKSFATSVSAWVLPLEALDGARVANPGQQPVPLPYLRQVPNWSFDVELDAWVRPLDGLPQRVSRTNARDLYWTPPQQIAHLTSNGSPIRAGDLIASGTISGDEERSQGSMLELAHGGARPIRIGGASRSFLENGDEVVITATAHREGGSVALGEVRGRIVH